MVMSLASLFHTYLAKINVQYLADSLDSFISSWKCHQEVITFLVNLLRLYVLMRDILQLLFEFQDSLDVFFVIHNYFSLLICSKAFFAVCNQ